MDNVHRLVIPDRDVGTASAAPASTRPSAEILILPCVRYERLDMREARARQRARLPLLTADSLA